MYVKIVVKKWFEYKLLIFQNVEVALPHRTENYEDKRRPSTRSTIDYELEFPKDISKKLKIMIRNIRVLGWNDCVNLNVNVRHLIKYHNINRKQIIHVKLKIGEHLTPKMEHAKSIRSKVYT